MKPSLTVNPPNASNVDVSSCSGKNCVASEEHYPCSLQAATLVATVPPNLVAMVPTAEATVFEEEARYPRRVHVAPLAHSSVSNVTVTPIHTAAAAAHHQHPQHQQSKPLYAVRDPFDGSFMTDENGHVVTVDRLLATKPLRGELQTRPGPGGKSLTYLSGDTVTRTLNDIFGFDGWHLQIISTEKTVCEKMPSLSSSNSNSSKQSAPPPPHWQAAYTAHARITHCASGTFREDVGAGDAIDRHLPTALQHALKAAVTDALKRAARHFGEKLGNALGTFRIKQAPLTTQDAILLADQERITRHNGTHATAKTATSIQQFPQKCKQETSKPTQQPPPPIPTSGPTVLQPPLSKHSATSSNLSLNLPQRQPGSVSHKASSVVDVQPTHHRRSNGSLPIAATTSLSEVPQKQRPVANLAKSIPHPQQSHSGASRDGHMPTKAASAEQLPHDQHIFEPTKAATSVANLQNPPPRQSQQHHSGVSEPTKTAAASVHKFTHPIPMTLHREHVPYQHHPQQSPVRNLSLPQYLPYLPQPSHPQFLLPPPPYNNAPSHYGKRAYSPTLSSVSTVDKRIKSAGALPPLQPNNPYANSNNQALPK